MKRTLRYILSAAMLSAASIVLLLTSCSREERLENMTVNFHGRELPASFFEQGVVRVKLTQAMADSLCVNDSGKITLASARAVKSVGDAAASLGIVSMKRSLPHAGKFEPRTRAKELHLWYNVVFDESTPLTRAMNSLSEVEGFSKVEYIPVTVPVNHGTAVEVPASGNSAAPSAAAVFNDPRLGDQWHYYNDGSLKNSIAGSDINVLPVWSSFTTGSQDVIVAVVDGGVDYSHEDLAANMWHNPEQGGDLAYGWNFITDGPRITAHDHGTHVAGTIAAVNNNGKGVCGIAGGNSAKNIPGVRIMSCQIFDNSDKSGSGVEAIKWAADHGAVIAQNSWGYSFETYEDAASFIVTDYDKSCIDYFTEYAGLDENGRQVGPMAGGIVIFAAGNDGWDTGHPGDYETCLAVGSIGADYRAAYYTNYGSWVDVAAPGGDTQMGREVLSTLPGNAYGYMQGTSMACPHVSGVAALVISHRGGPGFTSKALREILESSVRDISVYNRTKYIGKGLVDAYRAVVGTAGRPPAAVTGFEARAESNNVYFSVTVPSDPDNGKPNMIFVYYSESPLTESNYSSAMFQSYTVGDMEPGDVLEDVVTDLGFETQYYLTAVATDYGGLTSPMSTVLSVTTGQNHAPELTPLDGTSVEMKAWQTASLRFIAKDPDRHDIIPSAVTPDDTVSLSTVLNGDTLILNIQGRTSAPGTHSAVLRAEDPYGMYDEEVITYTVEQNKAPEKVKDLPGVAFSSSTAESVTLNMYEYFSDPDGEPLAISASSSNNSIAHVAVRGQNIIITPMSYGTTETTVTGTDALGETVSTTFNIVVRDASQPIDIYPNPVVDTLYIRAGSDSQGHVRITSASGSTVFDDDISVSIFDPAAIDMSALPGGMYVLTVEYEGTVIKRSIAKL